MEDCDQLLDRITANPDVLIGKPCIRGMRISVEHVLDALAGGITQQEFLEAEDIKAALLYVKELLRLERVYAVGKQG